MQNLILGDPLRVNPVALERFTTWAKQTLVNPQQAPAFVQSQAAAFATQIKITWHQLVWQLLKLIGSTIVGTGMSWPEALVDFLDYVADNSIASVRSAALLVQVAPVEVSVQVGRNVRQSANYEDNNDGW